MLQLEPYRTHLFVPKSLKKKPLTPEQERECAALKSIFESKKKILRVTQESLGLRMGMNQSSVGHYLNGRNPLNLDAATKFATLLGVDIAEFSQRLKKEALMVAFVASPDHKTGQLALLPVEQPHKVVVNSFAQIISNNRAQGREMQYYGEIHLNTVFLTVETDMMYGLSPVHAPRGSTLKISEGETPTPGVIAVFNLHDTVAIGTYVLIGDKPHVCPSNPQYPVIDVSDASLIGVVHAVIVELLPNS